MNTPNHYGGDSNPFEPVKIIDHYGLDFYTGNVLKYLLRYNRKGAPLEDLKKPNDTIFDSHMGSQSSRIACHMEGFDFTGCELDPEYFEQGNERYEAFLKTYGTPDPTKAIPGQQINLF